MMADTAAGSPNRRRSGTGRNVRLVRCSPDDIFDVLRDGWLYPAWVVGASRMRDVGDDWPSVGARLHHSVGVWPALIDDTTVVISWDAPRRTVLRARGWPIGEAEVTIEVRPRADGCVVRIDERAVRGPATLLPNAVTGLLLRWRNAETLNRLAYLAENQAGRRSPADLTES